MLIAEWKREDLERNKAILAVNMPPSGSEVQPSLFLICLHWLSQGSPLYSHNSDIWWNTGRRLRQPLVPYIIPRAREGRFVCEALGRRGSGEWVCCAWDGLIMEGFDLAAVWKEEPWEVLEDRSHHVEGESRPPALWAAVTCLTCIFWWVLGCTPASDSFPRTPTTLQNDGSQQHLYVCCVVLTDVLWTNDSDTARQLFHGGFEGPRSGGLVRRRLIAV